MSHLSFLNSILNNDIQADPELNLNNVFYKKIKYFNVIILSQIVDFVFRNFVLIFVSIQKSKIVKAGFIGHRWSPLLWPFSQVYNAMVHRKTCLFDLHSLYYCYFFCHLPLASEGWVNLWSPMTFGSPCQCCYHSSPVQCYSSLI